MSSEPAVARDPAHIFAHQILQALSAAAVDLWFQEPKTRSFRRAVAIGATPSDLFASQDIQQRLVTLLNETIVLGQQRAAPLAGLTLENSEIPSLVLMAPVCRDRVRLGIAVVVPRRPLAPIDQARQLQWLADRCMRFGERPDVDESASAASSSPVNVLSDEDSTQTKTARPVIVPAVPAPERKEIVATVAEPAVLPIVQPARLTKPSSAAIDLSAIMRFVLTLHRSLDLTEVCDAVVNDGRLLLGCDRVSVVLRRGRRVEVASVSGQESIQSRARVLRSMETLARQVLATGELLRSDDPPESHSPQVKEPLKDFIQTGRAGFVLMAPLWKPERLVPVEDSHSHSAKPTTDPRKVIGVLVLEQTSTGEPPAQLKENLTAVIDHIAEAIFNSRSHSTIFLLPLWRSMGRFQEWLRGWRLAIAGLLLATVIGAGIALAVVPWEYRIDATGRLMPVIQREVFAPWDGQVVEVLIEDGAEVSAGQELLKLRNDELIAERVSVENKLLEKRKLLASLNVQRDEAMQLGKRDEAIRLQGKAVETSVEIEGASEQKKILEDRIQRLTVTAPIAGIVTTFQIHQLLQNRPVQRGEVLLQIMDQSGDWQLELEIPEHRLGRVLMEQQRRRQESGAPAETFPELPISYCLLTQPESSYDAKLTTLSTRAVTAETQGTVIEARASLENKLPSHTIGAEVRARVSCGMSSLGDVLFGDLVEFAQKYLWW